VGSDLNVDFGFKQIIKRDARFIEEGLVNEVYLHDACIKTGVIVGVEKVDDFTRFVFIFATNGDDLRVLLAFDAVFG